jgi:manganese transport protein
MTIAGFVNLAMMATAAAAFHFNGHTGIADLDQAYLTLEPLLSHAAATIFGLSLVAAGLSSTVVGTLAGQVVMQGLCASIFRCGFVVPSPCCRHLS